jgi:ADP-ribosylglycohydrolase
MSEEVYDRILGCMVGSAVGDAFGAVVEFCRADRVEKLAGKQWVDQFLPYPDDFGTDPVGVWRAAPPRGTGTDDTRNNHIFAECVIRNGGEINSQLLAVEYVDRYRNREVYYPGYGELPERHLRYMYEPSCAHLGMMELPSGRPAWAVASQGIDSAEYSFPMLWGLISLAFAGLLYSGEPEKAYTKAFELSFLDLGYARDATAMMAAMISAAVGGGMSGKDVVKVGLEVNPFDFRRRIMVDELRKLLQLADQADSDPALVDAIAREVAHRHPFDPVDVLGQPAAAVYRCDGDPVRSVVMAANDRTLDGNGNLKRLRDVDCTAGVAGALAGALQGAGAFPADWVSDVLKANRDVYGIDIEGNARRFYEAAHGSR